MVQVAESARKFIITQIGLSCFIWVGSKLQAQTFNFYIVPREVPGFNKRFLVDVRLLFDHDILLMETIQSCLAQSSTAPYIYIYMYM